MMKREKGSMVLRTGGKEPTVMMKCAVCAFCWEDPESPGRCMYGGPYDGYVDAITAGETG